jgi:broad specificity phosphatase PhoE
MGTLAFVRHGQASLFSADYDELSERGRTQAEALGEHFGRIGFAPTAVYTGPARRQRDTAALVRERAEAAGLSWPDVVEHPGLDEHDAFGMIKRGLGKLTDDAAVARAQSELLAAEDRPARSRSFQRLFEAVMHRWLVGDVSADDAETWPAFRTRVDAAVAEMIAAAGSGARIVAFSSVGPLAVLLRRALHTSDADSFRTAWRCRNAAIASFVFSGDALTLDGFNALPHLPRSDEQTFR